MKLTGTCRYCGSLAKESCRLCGALCCLKHLVDEICAKCRIGKR